jgi:hypothetical protein
MTVTLGFFNSVLPDYLFKLKVIIMENFKLYIPTTVENVKIKFRISYSKESASWATNENYLPGYRVNAVPVTVTQRDGLQWEESGAFTGFNDTLVPCSRRSQSRYATSKVALDHRMRRYLKFFQEKGFKFTEEILNEFQVEKAVHDIG